MHKKLEILGDGQIWDLKGISPLDAKLTFEDLFSGRALGEMAGKKKEVFRAFKVKNRITGLSVTKALRSHDQKAKKTAKIVLEELAKNAALGIECLNKGKGFKNNWTARKKNLLQLSIHHHMQLLLPGHPTAGSSKSMTAL